MQIGNKSIFMVCTVYFIFIFRYLKCDLENFELQELGNMKFDVILVEPPLKHYNIANGAVYDKYWSWDDVSTIELLPLNPDHSWLTWQHKL